MPPETVHPRLDRPVFVVGAPRSGTTAVFNRLAGAAGVYAVGMDARNAVEQLDALQPASNGWESNLLTAADAGAHPDIADALADLYLAGSFDREQRSPSTRGPVRIIEKSVRHAMRVSFLAAAFPDAQFVYVHREPGAAISGMLDAWRSDRFVTYLDLPGWRGSKWSMPLVPGWRGLLSLPLSELVVHQWAAVSDALLDALEELPAERWCAIDRDDFVDDPDRCAAALCARLGLDWDRPILANTAASSGVDTTVPAKHVYLATDFAHVVAPIERRATQVLADRDVTVSSGAESESSGARRAGRRTAALLRSDSRTDDQTAAVHDVLRRAATSLLVSTFNANQLVIVRPGSGDRLGVRRYGFDRPMGVAVGRGRVAVAGPDRIVEFETHASLTSRVADRPVDACYAPSSIRFTGETFPQEMAYALGELWFVNTQFSCLSTLDRRHSFNPRWRPSFVSGLAPEDRCRLSGMAMRDGGPAFATAAAMTDEPQGWRREKVGGGVLIDVASGALVAHGLTLPHSPRLHDGRLWLLDSGNGTLCTVDVVNGIAEPVVQLPGFVRGLAFVGPYAVVGLSRLRSAALSGLPIGEDGAEQQAGIWMVDTRTGAVAGRLVFSDEAHEVFDVQPLRGMQFPEFVDEGDPTLASAYLLPADALGPARGSTTDLR